MERKHEMKGKGSLNRQGGNEQLMERSRRDNNIMLWWEVMVRNRVLLHGLRESHPRSVPLVASSVPISGQSGSNTSKECRRSASLLSYLQSVVQRDSLGGNTSQPRWQCHDEDEPLIFNLELRRLPQGAENQSQLLLS